MQTKNLEINSKFINSNQVVPVFFNVGINQEQTLAEKFGGSVLQEYLNREALGKLSAYYKQVSFLYVQTSSCFLLNSRTENFKTKIKDFVIFI